MHEQESDAQEMPVPLNNATQMIRNMMEVEQSRDETPYAALNRQDPNQSQWELDWMDVLDSIEHVLKGHYFDKKKNQWEDDLDLEGNEKYRMMNDRGIHDIRMLIVGLVNRNTFLTNLTEERVYYAIRTVRIELAALFAQHRAEYELKKEYMSYVLDIITLAVANAYFRALDGGERKGRWTTEVRKFVYGSTVPGEGQKKEKGGLLGLGVLGL